MLVWKQEFINEVGVRPLSVCVWCVSVRVWKQEFIDEVGVRPLSVCICACGVCLCVCGSSSSSTRWVYVH